MYPPADRVRADPAGEGHAVAEPGEADRDIGLRPGHATDEPVGPAQRLEAIREQQPHGLARSEYVRAGARVSSLASAYTQRARGAANEGLVDLHADAGPSRYRDRPVRVEGHPASDHAPAQAALGDVELDPVRLVEGGEVVQAVGVQEVGQPGMGDDLPPGGLRRSGDLSGHGQPTAPGQVRLHDIDATLLR